MSAPFVYVVQGGERVLVAELGADHVADARPDCLRCGHLVDEMRVTVGAGGVLQVLVRCHGEEKSYGFTCQEVLRTLAITVGPCFARENCQCPADEPHGCGRPP